MSDNIKSCCFTGYRPSKYKFEFNRDDQEYINFESKLTTAIFNMPQSGGIKFYCGMAMGFDILAGEIVAELKRVSSFPVELIAVLPFNGQADNWSPRWRERYYNLLKKADSVICVSNAYERGCYQQHNRYMVDKSDIVLTYFSGEPGGTAQTVAYAKRKGKKIINIADFPLQMNFELPYVFD